MSDPSRDPNEAAADAVHRLTDEGEPLPPDLEAAWEAWIKGIQGTDERVRTLLRAAFEAGAEAGGKSFAASGGRAGGKARADKLTPEQRSEIARKAAEARWSDQESSSSS